MHPVIVHAVATERGSEMRARAAAAQRARDGRRARAARPLAWLARLPKSRPAPVALRDPEAA